MSLPKGTQHDAAGAPTYIDIEGEVRLPLGLDRVGGGVPGDGGFAEIGFVGHMAGQSGVVAEDGVFRDLLMVTRALEKSPEVRLFFVPRSAAVGEPFCDDAFG